MAKLSGGRAAGSSSYYTFQLVRGESDSDEPTIYLPSVTSILSVLNKPALLGWYYKVTVAGVAELLSKGDLSGITADELSSALKAAGLRPHDLRDKGAARGTDVHEVCESIAVKLNKPDDFDDDASPHVQAFLKFWRAHPEIEVLAAELPVYSLRYGYAGTLDLLYRQGGLIWLVDIKTSKAVFPEHALQQVAYAEALREMGIHDPDRLAILRLGEDAEWELVAVDAPFELFTSARDLWLWLREGRVV